MTPSASATTVSASAKGVSTATEAPSASTKGMSAATEGTVTTTEAAPTATKRASATTEAATTATEVASTTIESAPASTNETIAGPTAKSSTPGKGLPASVIPTTSKAPSTVEPTSAIVAAPTPAPAPRAGANKDSAREPAWPVVAVGCAGVRVIGVVAIRTHGGWPWGHVTLIPIALIRIALIRVALIWIALIRIPVTRIPVAWIHWASSLGKGIGCNHQTQSQSQSQ